MGSFDLDPGRAGEQVVGRGRGWNALSGNVVLVAKAEPDGRYDGLVYEPGGDVPRGGRADQQLAGTLVSFGLGKVVSFDSSGLLSRVERGNMDYDSGSKMGRVLTAPGRLIRNGRRRWTWDFGRHAAGPRRRQRRL